MRRYGGLCVAGLICLAACAGAQIVDWTYYDSRGGTWNVAEGGLQVHEGGLVTFTRTAYHHDRIVAEVECDLDATPCLEIDARSATTPWRLTVQAADGPEVVVGDTQVNGRCVRNIARRLGVDGQTTLTLRMYIWGWGNTPWQYVRFRARMIPDEPETDADRLQGDMLYKDGRMEMKSEDYRLRVEGHPRLRYNEDNRDIWQERAQTTHAEYLGAIGTVLDELQERKQAEPWTLTPETYSSRRPAWGNGLISVRPPDPPEMPPGTGQDPFPGYWRDLCWHDYSHWLIGAAISDDPVFVEQCRRFAVTPVQWRFWLRPEYRYFDFEASYPLQCLSFAYDVAYDAMTEQERNEVREAIATIAHGLYLNTVSGHGSIYNDLRGNHTAVTMCGLGAAGLVLMGEHPDAGRWTALAETFLTDAFEEHESGAWLESPSYGAYGVNEWLKLAEFLNNVTGEDHLHDPFLRKFAEYQLHISDWAGCDLGYNQGGAGDYWNQWIFFRIAQSFDDSRFQWLGQHILGSMNGHTGYGDLFWWIDPSIEPKRPTETAEGRTFSDIGLSVWRSGWRPDATILLHHCGIKGQHKEENMNHVTLYARGEKLLPDAVGTRTADHNVPVVNGRKQNKWMSGETTAYHSDTICGYSSGSFHHYYGFTRQVLFLRPDMVVLVDDVNLPDDGAEVEFLLHPNGETQVAGNVASVTRGDASLSICTALPDGTLLPVTISELEKSDRATDTYSAALEASGPVRAITFIRIAGANPPELNVESTEQGLRLICGDGAVYHLGLSAGQIAPGFGTGAPLWLARMSDGEPEALMACTDPVMGHTDASVQLPEGRICGAPCVSWSR